MGKNLDRSAERTNTRISLNHLQAGSTFFTDCILKTSSLPTKPGWIWNQSRSRKTVHQFGWEICFYKANVRQAKYSPVTPPSFKVWIFLVKSYADQFSFLWCEKGCQPAPSFEEIPCPRAILPKPGSRSCNEFTPYHPDVVSVTLQDLSFLKPYVSHHTAQAFAW